MIVSMIEPFVVLFIEIISLWTTTNGELSWAAECVSNDGIT